MHIGTHKTRKMVALVVCFSTLKQQQLVRGSLQNSWKGVSCMKSYKFTFWFELIRHFLLIFYLNLSVIIMHYFCTELMSPVNLEWLCYQLCRYWYDNLTRYINYIDQQGFIVFLRLRLHSFFPLSCIETTNTDICLRVIV